MTVTSVLFVVAGVALLYLGGEALIRGAVHLASAMGLSKLVIGLTVVAFATSAPELAATLMATLRGAPGVAVGNVLGSNIANVGLILGLTAILTPLQSTIAFVQREVPMMIAASLVLFPLLMDLEIGRLEGAVLFGLLLLYLWQCLRSKSPPMPVGELVELDEAATPPVWRSAGLVVLGGGLLVFGAYLLVEGAVAIARAFEIPERVIGLTMVAFGTSLPELASSIAAARHDHADIVLGNVIGSNIFNVLCILGITAVVQPIPVELAAVRVDFWLMIAFSILVLPFHWPDLRLTRAKGIVFVALYLAYIGVLFLPGGP